MSATKSHYASTFVSVQSPITSVPASERLEEHAAEIVRLYVREDLAMADIAKRLGMSTKAISRCLRANSIAPRSWSRMRPLTPARAERRLRHALDHVQNLYQQRGIDFEAAANAELNLSFSLSRVMAERRGLKWNQSSTEVSA